MFIKCKQQCIYVYGKGNIFKSYLKRNYMLLYDFYMIYKLFIYLIKYLITIKTIINQLSNKVLGG